ncbi:MAG: SHOCT domain-containing protein [Blastocatellia bacterium]
MTREKQRRTALFVGVGLALWFLYLGDDWVINGFLPIWVLGLIFGITALLGFCGVNVFKGGPLDPQTDPSSEKALPAPDRQFSNTREAIEYGFGIQETVEPQPQSQRPTAPIPPEQSPDPFSRLMKLKQLHEAGIVTESEFQSKKNELLAQV